MKTEKKLLVCEHCGNLVEVIKESGVPIICCGQRMKAVEADAVSCDCGCNCGCGNAVPEVEVKVEEKACPLQPVNTETKENYKVCLCNNVSYFDILDAVHKHDKVDSLLGVFEGVKNMTHCSTGCGGCYDKVIKIISETMMNGEG